VKIFIFIFLFIINVFGQVSTTNNTKLNESSVEKKENLEFIKVSDIPESASNTILELKKINESTSIDKEMEDIKASIKPYIKSINKLLETKDYKKIDNANERKLQKMRNELVIYNKQLQNWESLLKKRIKLYDEKNNFLKNYMIKWEYTHKNAIKEKAPKSIKKHIRLVMSSIEKLTKDVKRKYDKALTNSQILTTEILIIDEKSKEMKDRELIIKNKIFYQNETPYFTAFNMNLFSFSAYVDTISITLSEKYNEILGYLQTHMDNLFKFIIMFIFGVIFILYNAYLYKKRKLFIRDESYTKKEFFFIKNIFSTISIAFILSSVAVYSQRPVSFTDMLLIIMIIPSIMVLRTVIDKKYYKYLYIFFTIFLLYYIDENSNNTNLEHRTFLLIINLSLIIYGIHIMINKSLFTIDNMLYNKIFKTIIIVFIVSLVFAIFSNLYGSVLLSIRIIDSVLNFVYISFIFYVFYMILTAYTIIILRKRIASASYTLEKYSHNIEKTTKLIIKIWMILWWLLSIVKLLGVYDYLMMFQDMFLATSWEVGKTIISVQAIVDFIFIIVITWVFAKLLKIFLEVEIFSRFKFPRGMPTAILTTLNYMIIISGTILAFSSLGVTTQQFALVIGALGVGIGFGLRNIIANFVSGIIMVFERPIQIGDIIEVDNTMGDVQSIGARSSTIKTFDGAEVIIPNADFIAKEIINWTLSDKQRRKTIDFKVSLDNDVDEVLKIMNEVAVSHKNVVSKPEPVPTFQGFGEYYLTFKLYFWLSDNIIEAQSEIAIHLYKKLKEAGINLPIPKTELKRK